MINELTAEQKAKFPEFVDKWLKIGLSTERIDIEKAQKISDYYYEKIAGKKKVPIIILDSPYSTWLGINYYFYLKNNNQKVLQEVWQEVDQKVWQKVRQEVLQEVRREVWQKVEQEVGQKVLQEVGQKVLQEVRQGVGREVRQEVVQGVGQKVRQEVRQGVVREVRQEVVQGVVREVGQKVRQKVEQEVEQEVLQEVDQKVWQEVRREVWQKVEQEVWQEVEQEVRQEVWQKVLQEVWQEVEQEVLQEVRREVGREVELMDFVYPYIDGHFSAGYFSYYDFMDDVLGIKYSCQEAWEWYKSTSQIGLFYPLDDICFISEKPIEINFKNDFLHADMKPAIIYADGFSVWSLNGVRCPKELVETPAGQLKPEDWLKNENVEVRREFIRKFGIERLKTYGKVIEAKEIKYKNKSSYYELIDMGTIIRPDTYCPYLKFEHASLSGVFGMEGVPPEVKTVEQALNFRLTGNKDIDMNFENINIS